MSEVMLAGTAIELDDEGYLKDASQWSEAVAQELAQVEGITLTDKHWEVLRYLREQSSQGVPLSIRRVGKSGIVTIKELYELFPGGPLKISSRLAGIPKPASCV